ncbi:MAG: hypothetical protein J7K26_00570 [Candidatus Aenigmarchaeota archaeon]|nr:hypothetical protein [Candidatus Aenigmarchaeota archaeon]
MKINNKTLLILTIILIFVKIIEVSITGAIVQGSVSLTVALLPDGSSCSLDSECDSGICCHNICRSQCPYCGDGYCDPGESSYTCSADCKRPSEESNPMYLRGGITEKLPEIITIEEIIIKKPTTIILSGKFNEKNLPKPGTIYINLRPIKTSKATIYSIKKINPEDYAQIPNESFTLAAYDINISGGLNHFCMNYQGYTDDAMIYKYENAWTPLDEIYKDNFTICGNITSAPYIIIGNVTPKESEIIVEPKDKSIYYLILLIVIILAIISMQRLWKKIY